MNKEHWNSVYLDGAVPAEIVQDMIDKSHSILLASLTKKARAEIAG
jgi:predicted DNA-binding protein (MmcQ/YjbR family)